MFIFLMCWGWWMSLCQYARKIFNVEGLNNDAHVGSSLYHASAVVVEFLFDKKKLSIWQVHLGIGHVVGSSACSVLHLELLRLNVGKVAWLLLDELWKQECKVLIGPIIGRSSDDNSRCRQLIVATIDL
jgi:hypothetical protein